MYHHKHLMQYADSINYLMKRSEDEFESQEEKVEFTKQCLEIYSVNEYFCKADKIPYAARAA